MKQGFVHQVFSGLAAEDPDRPAIEDSRGTRVTYGQLEESANRLAGHLLSEVGSGSIVAILAEDTVTVITAILASLKAGCTFVPLDPRLPGKRLELLMDQVEPAIRLHNLETINWNHVGPTPPPITSAPDAMSYIYFTSGSTGRPKGIAGRLKAIDHFVRWEIETLGLREGIRVSQFTNPSFDAYLRDTFVPLCAGGTVCVPPAFENGLDGPQLVNWIDDSRINLIHCVPSLFRALVHEDLRPEHFPNLKHILLSGEPLLPADVKRWMSVFGERIQLVNFYGPTETTMIKFFHFVTVADQERRSIPIGKPMADTKAIVVDAQGKACPLGTVGEIYIRTPYRSLGYFKEPELTSEVFIPNPFNNKPDDIVYKTGDLGRVLEDGSFEFLGRKDRQVKIRGIRVELSEIEDLLLGHEAVKDVVVVDREDTSGNKYLCAYVVLSGEVTWGALRDYLAEHGPAYLVPSAFVTLESLPRTPTGKVDRNALPAVGQEGNKIQRAFIAPGTETEQKLADVWVQVLGVERISVDDSFFELGGHSLLATQVISRIRLVFNIEISLRAMFELPTLRGLAARIDQARVASDEPGKTVTARPRDNGALPLSFAQQRLWFLDQLEPGTASYNLPAAVRLRGVLDLSALARSFAELIRRHETLRTTFHIAGEEPEQVISPAPAPGLLPFLDLSHLDVAGRDAQVPRLAQEEAQLPFDLAAGPLLRLRVLRLAEEEHVLLLTMHHIISDGWSMGVLIRELVTLYTAYSQGQPSPLPDLPVQYADYAIWQREYLTGELLDQQVDYWRKQLQGVAALELPRDKPRRSERNYRAASAGFKLNRELTQSLQKLSERAGATLFMTLLAAFQTLLHRYTNQPDISVGTPIANRNRAEIEDLIGFFVNTLVMRADFANDPTFSELLGRVRETALGAYANQDVPFERLVEELQPERDLSHSPFFQVLFTLQNAPAAKAELPGLELKVLDRQIQFARFDLSLVLDHSDDGVSGELIGSLDLFEPERLHRFLEHYEVLLKSIVADPEQKISQLQILSDAERQRVLIEWNESQHEYAPASTLSELFEAQAARTPEAVALRFENTTVGYRELNERANQLAWYLQTKGVGPEVLVGILMDRSVEMIVAVLGILKAGGAYVPLDPSYPAERLEFMVHDSGMRMLLTQERLREVPGGYTGATLSLTEQWEAIASESSANLPSSAKPENVAYVIYTSGSTGRPKGVLVSHENVVRLLDATQTHFEFNQRDVWTLFHSYAFDFSVWEIWGALAYGGKLVIVPYWISRSAEAFHALLASEQVTVLNQTPSAFRQLIAADESAGEELKLRLVIFGGEALELQTLRPWFARHGDRTPRLINMFGITETTVHVTYRPLTADDLELASSSVIGRPLECLQLYLLDERGQPVPIGVPGEICVGGTGLARGYLNRAELTAERFVPHPFSALPGERLYRSGDLARYLSNGDIEYLGRIDQQVKVRGFRIELGEIEAVLAQHEAVRECTVVANADANGETKLLAYLVARQQQTPSVTELREFLQQKLPEYMIPAAFTALDAMPLTPNGKIDRKALPAPGQDRPALFGEYVAPRSAVEQVLARIWAELLHVERVGLNDNFFDLGGHSLMATRLVARLRSVLSIELPLRSVFENPTLVGLSEIVLEQPGQRARIEKTAELLLELERLSEGEADRMLEEVMVSTVEREAR